MEYYYLLALFFWICYPSPAFSLPIQTLRQTSPQLLTPDGVFAPADETTEKTMTMLELETETGTKEIEVFDFIGTGKFGTVWKVKIPDYGKEYAMKVHTMFGGFDSFERDRAMYCSIPPNDRVHLVELLWFVNVPTLDFIRYDAKSFVSPLVDFCEGFQKNGKSEKPDLLAHKVALIMEVCHYDLAKGIKNFKDMDEDSLPCMLKATSQVLEGAKSISKGTYVVL